MNIAKRVIAYVDINTRFFRGEHWNVLRYAFHLLDGKLKKAGLGPVNPMKISDVLLAAGLVFDDSLPRLTGTDFRPQARLAPMAERGKVLRLQVDEDGVLSHEFLSEVFPEVKP